MLTNPTIDMLRELGLSGMASAYHELDAQPEEPRAWRMACPSSGA